MMCSGASRRTATFAAHRAASAEAAEPSWPTMRPPRMSTLVATSIMAWLLSPDPDALGGVEPQPVAVGGAEDLVELVEVAHDVRAELRRAVRVDGEVLLLLLLAALGPPAVGPVHEQRATRLLVG